MSLNVFKFSLMLKYSCKKRNKILKSRKHLLQFKIRIITFVILNVFLDKLQIPNSLKWKNSTLKNQKLVHKLVAKCICVQKPNRNCMQVHCI